LSFVGEVQGSPNVFVNRLVLPEIPPLARPADRLPIGGPAPEDIITHRKPFDNWTNRAAGARLAAGSRTATFRY
jgi:hypothetical protein